VSTLAELERAAQQAREAAEAAGEPWPPYVPMPVGPKPAEHREPVVDKIVGTVLANVDMQPRDAARLCSALGLTFGITKPKPHGQVHPSWSWRIIWGLGRRNHDGLLTESLALKCEHPSGRNVLWVWTRTPPNVALLLAALTPPSALGRTGPHHADYMPPLWWPVLAALLRALPSTKWTSSMVLEWTRLGPGRITQPEPIASTEARKIIRIGGWA